MFVGFALLIAGVLMLLSKLDIISGGFWDYFLPIILVALGAEMIFDRKKRRE